MLHRRRLLATGSLLALAAACASCGGAPPPAPAEYAALMAYIFRYMKDDTGQLTKGLEDLAAWLRDPMNRKHAESGFSIHELDLSAVDELDGRMRTAKNLEGISVVTRSAHPVEQIAALLTWTGFSKVVAGNYSVYHRSFTGDPGCFKDRSCTWLEAHSHTESKWAGLISVKTDYTIQFRWVKTAAGWMMLHRFWLDAPADGSCCGLKMNGNYYVEVVLPDSASGSAPTAAASDDGPAAASDAGPTAVSDAASETGPDGASETGPDAASAAAGTAPGAGPDAALRVHANWFDVDDGAFGFLVGNPGDRVVDSTRTDAQRVDDWITHHPADVE